MSDLWYYAANGQDSRGPFPRAEIFQLAAAGIIQRTTLVWNEGMAQWLTFESCFGEAKQVARGRPGPENFFGFNSQLNDTPKTIANKIANLEIVSLSLWSILSILQIFLLPGMTVTIVGFYNAIMVATHFPTIEMIKNQNKEILNSYENTTPLIIAGVANLIFGAFLGVIIVAFDFYIRNIIIKNKSIFVN